MSYFKNRLFIIILAAVLLCSITILSLPSCQSANTDTGNNNDTEEIKGETVTESSIPDNAAADTTEERLYANVPDADYGGYEFKILTFAEAGNPVHDHPDLTAETENGDILNDAVYKRNITIEERFNIRLKEIHSINSTSDLQKSVNTQSDLYDLVGQRMVISLAPITGGYYMNLRELPNLDLTKPWYIQSSVENLTFKGKLFTVYSEMLIAPYCATAVIVFNKKLHSDYGLADPYQMVKDGKWTIDALYEMCKDGSKDLNGDGEMTFIDDQWGFMTGVDVMAAFLFGGGGRISKIQSDGSIDFTLANEKNFDIMDKAFQIIYNDDITMNVHKGNHNQPNPNLAMDKLWMDGRALFGGTRISNIRMWREMDIPFGMLPIPKYDVTQDKYYSVVSPFQA
ncbi:MAG: hypothetical protein FWD23_18030, partial [Oscillospiraceae bacterium]|nr:hypothetical protein [Oscillospiraceae bacterium]